MDSLRKFQSTYSTLVKVRADNVIRCAQRVVETDLPVPPGAWRGQRRRFGFDAALLRGCGTVTGAGSGQRSVPRLPMPHAYDDGGPNLARALDLGSVLPGSDCDGGWAVVDRGD